MRELHPGSATAHRLTRTQVRSEPAGARQGPGRHVEQPQVEAGHVPPAGAADATDELTGGLRVVWLDDAVAGGRKVV